MDLHLQPEIAFFNIILRKEFVDFVVRLELVQIVVALRQDPEFDVASPASRTMTVDQCHCAFVFLHVLQNRRIITGEVTVCRKLVIIPDGILPFVRFKVLNEAYGDQNRFLIAPKESTDTPKHVRCVTESVLGLTWAENVWLRRLIDLLLKTFEQVSEKTARFLVELISAQVAGFEFFWDAFVDFFLVLAVHITDVAFQGTPCSDTDNARRMRQGRTVLAEVTVYGLDVLQVFRDGR
jgi:hypothetical protein